MASPVVINSSSPNSIRLPTITPPSRRGSTKHAISSSPALPSPSAFVKPKTAVLKSGSRVQAIPASAGFGFATAGSLWRESRFGEDALQDGSRQTEAMDNEPLRVAPVKKTATKRKPKEQEIAQTETAGKLKKPKKTPRHEKEAAAGKTGSITFDVQDFVCGHVTTHPKAALVRPSPTKAAAGPSKQVAPTRRPSVDLSDFTFGVYDLGMQTQAPAAVSAAKRPRKKATTAKDSNDSRNAKPRKRKAKSEAVILNSDDPVDQDAAPAEEAVKSRGKTASKESRPKGQTKPEAKLETRGADEKSVKSARDTAKAALPKPCDAAAEQSVYFAVTPAVPATDGIDDRTIASAQLQQPTEPQQAAEDHEPQKAAGRRRMSWTPVRDTEHANRDLCGDAVVSPSASSPKVQLTDLLGDFSYIDTNANKPLVERTTNREAMTKRRRIDLADVATAAPASHKGPATSDVSETKQAKKPAGRKKLQTITALATAAYQPPPEESTEQSTVSEFFAPRKEQESLAKEAVPVIEKPKKPRKPREKKADAEGGDDTIAAPAKKGKKVRVKFNEADFRMKLYSPARATAQMNHQNFLFGTSSQLAVDESPSFVRDMQAAVQASETESSRPRHDTFGIPGESYDALPSQLVDMPRGRKSCAQVATAPHGTCLSLEQARRELWCVSSRDDAGGFFRELPGDHSKAILPSATDNEGHAVPNPPMPPPAELREGLELTESRPTGEEADDLPDPAAVTSNHVHVDDSDPDIHQDEQSVVDLSDTSPPRPPENVEDSAVAFDNDCAPAGLAVKPALHQDPVAPEDADCAPEPDADSWMLISSDGPEAAGARSPQPVVREMHRNTCQSALPHRLSPSRTRNVLQPLDANAGPSLFANMKEVSAAQARPFSATAPDPASKAATGNGKPRGRPRKDAAAPNPTDTPPKERGRPPKRTLIASDPSPEAAKFKKPKAAVSASQPLQSPSGWLDVDEISDSDSPVTPSPPRRRASSSPPAVPTLDIAVDGSPLAKLKEKAPAIIAATSTFKPGEPQWPSIREQIFPKISMAIKDAPRGTDPSKPSWYQKILMYDPITLEELTAWLSEQGLRIEVHKQKPKVKKRGRKKKDADGKVIEEDSTVEWEAHEEPLQAWMVQKWCEERSICCVWAGGGWGGRARH